MSFFSELSNVLSQAGVSSTTLPSVASSVAKLMGKNSALKTELTTLMSVAGSPAALAKALTDLETTEGFPQAFMSAAESLRAPGITAAEVMEFVTSVEQATA